MLRKPWMPAFLCRNESKAEFVRDLDDRIQSSLWLKYGGHILKFMKGNFKKREMLLSQTEHTKNTFFTMNRHTFFLQ